MKSQLIGPHHIYANPAATEGYRSGKFPDGSVLVFELLEVSENAGITNEGPLRRVDMMAKGGGRWGFQRFVDGKPMLSTAAQAECFACHQKRSVHDFVFSELRK